MAEDDRLSLYRELGERRVQEILESRGGVDKGGDIVAAYSDGSVARGDIFPGSDIDIAIIVDNKDEPWKVHRTVNEEHDVLIEWAFIPKGKYTDIKEVLGDAGFTHDIKDAYIYYDPTDFFEEVREEVRERYEDRSRVVRAARNQLESIEDTLNQVEEAVKTKDREKLNSSMVNLIKFSAAFPRAVLNEPLTNTRALIWCQEATQKLGAEEYYDLVLELMGSKNLDKEDAQRFLDLARETVSLMDKDDNSMETLLHHLKAPQYLIDNGYGQESFYKTLLWAKTAVKKAKEGGSSNLDSINELWKEMLSMIGWRDWREIKKKVEVAREIVRSGSGILKENQ